MPDTTGDLSSFSDPSPHDRAVRAFSTIRDELRSVPNEDWHKADYRRFIRRIRFVANEFLSKENAAVVMSGIARIDSGSAVWRAAEGIVRILNELIDDLVFIGARTDR